MRAWHSFASTTVLTRATAGNRSEDTSKDGKMGNVVRKQKIAILGGGLGALSAAYWLSESPDAAERYEITIYQQGWRLGGKGASGRSMQPERGHRIEEHGLHIWFGFYENAFRTYRQVLDALNALPFPPVLTFKDWHQAFHPHSLVVLGDNGPGGLEQWPILFPDNNRQPGCGQHPSPWSMLVETLRLGTNFFEGRFGNKVAGPARSQKLLGRSTAAVWWTERAAWRAVTSIVHRFARWLPKEPLQDLPFAEPAFMRLLVLYRAAVRKALRDVVPQDERARRMWVVSDLLSSLALGILRDNLLREGFERADHLEFSDWLALHGADPEITLKSNIVRVLYDLMFAYRGGDSASPNIAAGTGALTLLQVIAGYDGSFMYKMQTGMGDAIFTPFYGLLKARGVRFEFFHRVDRLSPNADGCIDKIHCTRQVRLRPEVIARGGYDPLVRIQSHDTWPATPRFEQIVNGRRLQNDPLNPGHAYDLESDWTSWPGAGTRTLQRGIDFDLVVCGIPIGALERIGAELIPRSPEWRRMLRGENRVGTVRTQAAQVWFRRTSGEMGWNPPDRMRDAALRGRAAPLLGGYLHPFNTWCDMSQVLAREEPWRGVGEARSVAYLCGQMPDDPQQAANHDHGYPRRQRERVREAARDWFVHAAPVLWPRAIDPRSPIGIDRSLLLAAKVDTAFEEQYFRANIDGSERYTLSLAGTTDSRPLPHSGDFRNLYLAGDWVRNPVLNAGCVESSVASGMAAARAICGFPQRIEGESEATRRRLGQEQATVPRQTASVAFPIPQAPEVERGRLGKWPEPAGRGLGTGSAQDAVDGAAGRFVGALHTGQIGVGLDVVGREKQIGHAGHRLRAQGPGPGLVDQKPFPVGLEGTADLVEDQTRIEKPGVEDVVG